MFDNKQYRLIYQFEGMRKVYKTFERPETMEKWAKFIQNEYNLHWACEDYSGEEYGGAGYHDCRLSPELKDRDPKLVFIQKQERGVGTWQNTN